MYENAEKPGDIFPTVASIIYSNEYYIYRGTTVLPNDTHDTIARRLSLPRPHSLCKIAHADRMGVTYRGCRSKVRSILEPTWLRIAQYQYFLNRVYRTNCSVPHPTSQTTSNCCCFKLQ